MNNNRGVMWIARDLDGTLYFYRVKPVKGETSWNVVPFSFNDFVEVETDGAPWFPEVKWEDEEPIELSLLPTRGGDETWADYEARLWSGEDFSLYGNSLVFATGKKHAELQCEIQEGPDEYQSVFSLCERIKKDFIELNKLLNKGKHVGSER